MRSKGEVLVFSPTPPPVAPSILKIVPCSSARQQLVRRIMRQTDFFRPMLQIRESHVCLKARCLHRCTAINNPPVIIFCEQRFCEQVVKCQQSCYMCEALLVLLSAEHLPAVNKQLGSLCHLWSLWGKCPLNPLHPVQQSSLSLTPCDSTFNSSL